MGYTTEFSGEFVITPALSEELVDQLNEFCSARHEAHGPGSSFDLNDLNRTYNGPLHDTTSIGIWADWEFVPPENGADATVMQWNGNEKSYDMAQWGQYLVNLLPAGHTVTGTIFAAGEDSGDLWKMTADGRVVTVGKAAITWE